ncbi:MAG: hypothetical protein M5U01_42610 [Ardenticatenaceae bacterium]|nr:hypothetical protein [Ardenticatenaceae bacterium]HBY93253.1 hypothetical protein [Chloroflexota bacterium]
MEKRVGQVSHYYNRLGVAVLDLIEGLKVGDEVHIHGRSRDLTQRIESMEIDHHKVQEVGPGANVALKVVGRVKKGDTVYKVLEEAGAEYL